PPRTGGRGGAGRASSLLGLAPGGVYRAASVTGDAVGSYPTVSPLPVPPVGPSAVCSLWHCPSRHRARVLPGTLPCGARTFLGRRTAGRGPHSLPIYQTALGALPFPLPPFPGPGPPSRRPAMRPGGVDPPPFGSVVQRSIQLRYGRDEERTTPVARRRR